jgi:hypothetical protein
VIVTRDEFFHVGWPGGQGGDEVCHIQEGGPKLTMLAYANDFGIALEGGVDWGEEALKAWEDESNVSQFANDASIAFQLDVFLLQNFPYFSHDVGCLGIGDAHRFGSAVHDEAQQFFFMIPASVPFHEFLQRYGVFAANMAGDLRRRENGVDPMEGCSGDPTQEGAFGILHRCRDIIVDIDDRGVGRVT